MALRTGRNCGNYGLAALLISINSYAAPSLSAGA